MYTTLGIEPRTIPIRGDTAILIASVGLKKEEPSCSETGLSFKLLEQHCLASTMPECYTFQRKLCNFISDTVLEMEAAEYGESQI